jgi:hypothetical protein
VTTPGWAITDGFPRPLTDVEKAILNRILEPEFEGAEEYRSQVEFATAVSKCGCGCPSVNFEVDRSAPRATDDPGYGPLDVEAVISAHGEDPAAGILVFSKDGYLVSLEYLDVQGTGESQWPDLNRVSAVKY